VIAACRKCGELVEMTTEEACTPVWNCGPKDRVCMDCITAAEQEQQEKKKGTTTGRN